MTNFDNTSKSQPNPMQRPVGQGMEPVATQAANAGRTFQDKAAELADAAARTLKDQASAFADTAKEVAKNAGEKLETTVERQKDSSAEFVDGIAQSVSRAAGEFDQSMPQAAEYIRKAATQLENFSQAVRDRNFKELVGEVQGFARSQPTAFFGVALIAGFAAVRFIKSASDSSASDSEGLRSDTVSRSDASRRYEAPGGF